MKSSLCICVCAIGLFTACGGDDSHPSSPAADGGIIDAGKTGASGSTSAAGQGGSSGSAGTAGQSGAGGTMSSTDDGGICTYVPADTPADCPDDLPPNCPDPTPSYGSEVSMIIKNYCVPCHRAGGLAADRQFGTYSVVFKNRTDMLSRLASCAMPPTCAAQPSPTERAALLSWLVCNAPNN